ncbi:MAG: DUF429 domain-containing protein [Akkermansiaceae bacterium]|nr:DUF429 domain-containing protein [Akkermansiaceae bacterium]
MSAKSKSQQRDLPAPRVLGIDVGAPRKGFHAVAMGANLQVEPRHFGDVEALRDWALDLQPAAIAIDAPCAWSSEGRSRQAERELRLDGEKISCFSTPTEAVAGDRDFYRWVHHGIGLYRALEPHFALYRGEGRSQPMLLETFPHAVACALAGKLLRAHPKSPMRRGLLRQIGIREAELANIDFVDAALCAVAARAWSEESFQAFGNPAEGYIVIPKPIDNEVPHPNR